MPRKTSKVPEYKMHVTLAHFRSRQFFLSKCKDFFCQIPYSNRLSSEVHSALTFQCSLPHKCRQMPVVPSSFSLLAEIGFVTFTPGGIRHKAIKLGFSSQL